MTETNRIIEAIQNVNIVRHLLRDDGQFPNNALLPLLVYQKVLRIPQNDPAKMVTELFESNDWVEAWVNGVYDFHHYHSRAHEVLGIIKGSARIQFGGNHGVAILLELGDIVIIPAGTAHKAIDVYDDFTVVGAYPSGQKPDMNYGTEVHREEIVERIKSLDLPVTDPAYGMEGPLLTNWKR